MPSYTVYGLTLESEFPISGLPAAEPGSADVQIHFGFLPQRPRGADEATLWYESVARDTAGEPSLRIHRFSSTGDLWLRYTDGTEFLIEASARSVWAAWPARFTIDDAIVYLLGPVLGILLRLRRTTSLHASVVEVDGRALGFAGPGGAGKSTIAATFARAEHAVLSDDLLVLNERGGQFWAEPGYSWLRLWPASAAGLYGAPDALPRLVTGWDKRYIDLAAQGVFCAEPMQMGAIYIIGGRTTDSPRPIIEPVSAQEALLSLFANSFVGHLPGPSERREEFELFGRLAASVPVRRLVASEGWESVANLPQTVLEDFAELSSTRVG